MPLTKNFIYLSIFSAFFFSCTRPMMQLVTVKSENLTLKDKHLVFEDSIVKIEYDFYSPNGVLKFNVYNKLSSPLFLDLKNSSFIVYKNNVCKCEKEEFASYNFLEAKASASSNVTASNYKSMGDSDPDVIVLLPETNIEISKFQLAEGKDFPVNTPTNLIYDNYTWIASSEKSEIRQHAFEREESPLKFKNYLTISSSKNFTNPVHYDFNFWVSEVCEMDSRQLVGDFCFLTNLYSTGENSPYHPYKSSDKFFVVK